MTRLNNEQLTELGNKQLKGVWSYIGFGAPEKLGNNLSEFIKALKSGDSVITDNYIGDASADLAEELQDRLDEEIDSDEYAELSIYINPTVNDFMELNTGVGLSPETYLEGFI